MATGISAGVQVPRRVGQRTRRGTFLCLEVVVVGCLSLFSLLSMYSLRVCLTLVPLLQTLKQDAVGFNLGPAVGSDSTAHHGLPRGAHEFVYALAEKAAGAFVDMGLEVLVLRPELSRPRRLATLRHLYRRLEGRCPQTRSGRCQIRGQLQKHRPHSQRGRTRAGQVRSGA